MNYEFNQGKINASKLIWFNAVRYGAAVEDYMKLLHRLSCDAHKVTPSMIAESMNVSAAAVTKMVKRLQEIDLITYSRKIGLKMTPKGNTVALEVIRHHRLLETYLHDHLGYSWDEVHAEAERLEHVISETFEDKIAQLLGNPTHDPHGDPIPARDGSFESLEETPLSDMHTGEAGVILRVADKRPEMLRYMADIDLVPGTEVKIVNIEPFGGPYELHVSGQTRMIGKELAENIFFATQEIRKLSL